MRRWGPRDLLLASALMLFLELALIRWLGANVVHLSYFSNFVLLGSFLGIGLGFLVARTHRSMLAWSPLALTLLVGVVRVVPVEIDQSSDEIIYFTSLVPDGPPAWLMLPIVFCAVAAVLAGPAEAVGRCFATMPPLAAYRLDLVGSLVGIGAFSGLSFLRAPSVVWGVVVAGAFLALWRPRPPLRVATAAVVLVGLLAIESLATAEVRLASEPQYGLPYERLPDNSLGAVLVVGAGSGSDVAIALSKGARHVDAVEIDPRILQIGVERHPDRPYQDPRVDTIVNDGRAYLERTDKTYDLILFALPDSLALVTGASAIRLESYLFTEEAVETARDHLEPGGGFAMYNYYREDRLIDRLRGTVAKVFGHSPCIDRVGFGQAVVAAGLTVDDQTCAPGQVGLAASRAETATDDRPFLYFFGSFLPTMYLVALAGILAVSLLAVRVVGGPLRSMRPYADLFFMGAAFLLLEN